MSQALGAGDEFFFTDFFPDGVSRFTLQGIDLDPGDPDEFRSGVTFVHASTVDFTLRPVPEPSTLLLAALGLLGLAFFGRRRRRPE